MEFATKSLLVFIMTTSLAFANAQTTVDWTLSKDYSSYSTQSLKPGGTIVFNYDKTNHNVEVVSKSDYDNCVTGNALQSFQDGKTTITLKQGTTYFICGIPGHCAGGMKLQVTAGEAGSTTPTTPTSPSTPSTTPDGSGSTPTTTSAPSPKDSNGAASISSHLVVVVALVGALVAFMG